jgi:O-antigen/teichoic acid export membrane protein
MLITNLARSVKFLSMGLAIPIGIISGLAIPFLTWWIGPQYSSLYVLVWLMISHQVLNGAIEPVGATHLAANRLVVPCIATIAGGLIKLAIGIALIKYTHFGVFGVGIAGMITFTLRFLIFSPVYAGIILRKSVMPIYRALIPGVLVFGCTAAAAWVLSNRFCLTTLPRIFSAGFVVMVLSAIAVYFIAMNAQDKAFLRQVTPWSRKRGAV